MERLESCLCLLMLSGQVFFLGVAAEMQLWVVNVCRECNVRGLVKPLPLGLKRKSIYVNFVKQR